MVQSSSMLVQGVHYGLMILNGPVVQYGPIQSNGGSWWSWLVPYVCEGLSATCVKADGRLTLCMTCIPIFEDGAGGGVSVVFPSIIVSNMLGIIVYPHAYAVPFPGISMFTAFSSTKWILFFVAVRLA